MRKDIEVWNPRCQYCKGYGELIDSAEIYNGTSYGFMWLCRKCNARVSCHKGTKIPTGTLAKPELMELRKQCHALFDPLWKSKKMRRHEAYRWLAKKMNLQFKHAHIGFMGEKKCKQFLKILNSEIL